MSRMRIRPMEGGGRPIPLDFEPVSLGRHPASTLKVEDERASRKHCVIEPAAEGQWVVRDLGSRNGTKLNGLAVDEAVLTPGDVIRIGKVEFVIEEAAGNGEEASGTKAGDADGGAVDGGGSAWVVELEGVLGGLPPKGETAPDITPIFANGKPSAALKSGGDGPRCLLLLLQIASKARATDIHIEPKQDSAQVRMRVDGQMVWIVDLPRRTGDLVGGMIKTLCLMKTAASDSVLDGHFSTRFPDRRVDYRVSFTPSVHGQKLVVRVLDDREIPHSISELGLVPWMEERLRRICEADSGLLLSVGPTGSGKTTTLYNVLRGIDREKRNVITIEDPVEYHVDGVTQIPINEQRGNTFHSLLRSVLRQDPDVILLGEIRDEETARTGMQAALTGHVVLSTLHAKDTISAVFRLLDLKIEPYLVANALDLVLAQRLVRMLCEQCKREMPVAPGQATRIGKYLGGKTKTNVAVGCAACLKTGYRGRRAIFEMLDFRNDELRDVVLGEPSVQAMRKIASQGLFITLQQAGWKLAAEGVASLDEVEHIAG
ncbi:MAG TPA: ATPase, T2SS/T4P/T4SS family [Phycisphaerales bacterium]|nr:ATPase, T2SS/T4P/T4SS family [Phycisphaerales bacterium]